MLMKNKKQPLKRPPLNACSPLQYSRSCAEKLQKERKVVKKEKSESIAEHFQLKSGAFGKNLNGLIVRIFGKILYSGRDRMLKIIHQFLF